MPELVFRALSRGQALVWFDQYCWIVPVETISEGILASTQMRLKEPDERLPGFWESGIGAIFGGSGGPAHFGVVALDHSDGVYWGWSYRQARFWNMEQNASALGIFGLHDECANEMQDRIQTNNIPLGPPVEGFVSAVVLR